MDSSGYKLKVIDVVDVSCEKYKAYRVFPIKNTNKYVILSRSYKPDYDMMMLSLWQIGIEEQKRIWSVALDYTNAFTEIHHIDTLDSNIVIGKKHDDIYIHDHKTGKLIQTISILGGGVYCDLQSLCVADNKIVVCCSSNGLVLMNKDGKFLQHCHDDVRINNIVIKGEYVYYLNSGDVYINGGDVFRWNVKNNKHERVLVPCGDDKVKKMLLNVIDDHIIYTTVKHSFDQRYSCWINKYELYVDHKKITSSNRYIGKCVHLHNNIIAIDNDGLLQVYDIYGEEHQRFYHINDIDYIDDIASIDSKLISIHKNKLSISTFIETPGDKVKAAR